MDLCCVCGAVGLAQGQVALHTCSTMQHRAAGMGEKMWDGVSRVYSIACQLAAAASCGVACVCPTTCLQCDYGTARCCITLSALAQAEGVCELSMCGCCW